MDVSQLLDELNQAQRQAVCAPKTNQLVLAGAGSGKTRVLVHRIAWLIKTAGVSPHAILAVTFTNKAAAEMRGRIEQLLQIPVQGLWVGTFHSLAHRLLRLHFQDAGLPQNFQILDSDDQLRTVKRILRELDIDESKWPPKQVQWYINGRKDEGQRAANIEPGRLHFEQQLLRIYQHYEAYCQRSGLVDFAELLLRAQELWLKNPSLLRHYQQRFAHILVDEFQDTNTIQYAWIRLLAGKQLTVFAVGDDDQSIYGWRGARIENIQRFDQDFTAVSTVRLEQNYRSTGNILAAANALISRNIGRLGKKLWTADAEGEPVKLYQAYSEQDEARFIVGQIRDWVEADSRRFDHCAILYRSNAQSRVLEEALIQAALPYRVYGGLRFFERAEIKDALAYVRLMTNPSDDASLERIINTPTRGIGEKTLADIRDHARLHGFSLFQTLEGAGEAKLLSARAANAVTSFVEMMRNLTLSSQGLKLDQLIEFITRHSGLYEHYEKDKSESGLSRIENLEELFNAARYFDPRETTEEMDELSAFLSHAALEAGEGQGAKWDDCVQLMTLHSAKGLEFPLVFMSGVEEGLFPHRQSLQEEGRLEEERRLCYVGITRARQQLYLTYAESRRIYGTSTYPQASRFISEIPSELLQEVRLKGSVVNPLYREEDFAAESDEYQLGQRVRHGKFGEGVVVSYEGQGAQARIQINFKGLGSKWLMVAYANLET